MPWTTKLTEVQLDQLEDPAVNLLFNILSGLDPADLTEDEVEMMVAKFGDGIRKDLRP